MASEGLASEEAPGKPELCQREGGHGGGGVVLLIAQSCVRATLLQHISQLTAEHSVYLRNQMNTS